MDIKKKLIKNIFSIISLGMIFGSIGNTAVAVMADSLTTDRVTGVTTEPTQYVGYGYNMAGGKAIYENDALMLNNPILDTESEIIRKNIKVFDGSKTEYLNNSFTRRSELAENYGQIISGGLSVQAQVSAVNLNIGAKFSNSTAENWGSIASEEFSYYTIFAGNRPVVLQMDPSALSEHLSERFENDLYSVNSPTDALNLFKKYGTHLLTGYTLGGIFEMTNYYATNSSEYVKENETSFEAQVGMALGSFAGGGGDFSFTNNYGYKDNNQYATNQYKCTTYGGLAFPGLTIDQAFSWYETLSSSGYVYQLWTDSINAGKNLVIVSIPQSSKMIPLWQLLPINSNRDDIKNLLIEAYAKISKEAYEKYGESNKDNFITGVDNVYEAEDEFVFEEKGFSYLKPVNDGVGNGYVTSYIDARKVDSTNAYDVIKNSIIQMDYYNEDFVGQNAEWVVEGAGKNYVDIIDPRNGIFKVKDLESLDDNIPSFRVKFYVNGKNIFSRFFKIKTNGKFSGGDGSQTSPYLIANYNDLALFASNSQYWKEGVYATLINDIDCENQPLDIISPNSSDAYYGVFDGNYHTIYNYRSNVPVPTDTDHRYVAKFGLFGYNRGTIKNLTMDYMNTPFTIEGVTNDTEKGDTISASALVCFSTGRSLIENCFVKNLNVVVENKKFKDGENSEFYIGCLVGVGQGEIVNSHVENINLVFNRLDKMDDVSVYLGGIVGNLNNEGSLEKSSITSATIETHGEYEIKEAFIGGAVANMDSAKMSDVLVNKFNVIPNSKLTKCYIGGVVGKCANSTITKTIIINSYELAKEIKLTGVETNALFVGYYDERVSSITITSSLCNYDSSVTDPRIIAEISTGIFDIGQYMDSDGIILCPGKISRNSVSSFLIDEDTWLYNDTKQIYIRKNGINYDSLELESEEAQKTFYVGENFKANGLSIKGLRTNGDEFETRNYILDFSNYDPTEVGSYDINVRAYGKAFSYKVKVISDEGHNIYALKDPNLEKDKTYYVGDDVSTFDLDAIELHYVSMLGKDVIVDTDTEKDKITYSLTTPTFKEGSNEIILKYNGLEYSYYVDAVKRKVDKIVVDKDTISKDAYNVGTRNIDFTSLSVDVHFENGDVKTVDGSECEFIHSTIVKGDNTITITYDVTTSSTFVVKGDFLAPNGLVQSFIQSVGQIDSNTTMVERYQMIKKAILLYHQIGFDYRYAGDEDFNFALDQLNLLIEEYNRDAGVINGEYAQNIVIANGLTEVIIMNMGYTLLGAMILFIIKLI